MEIIQALLMVVPITAQYAALDIQNILRAKKVNANSKVLKRQLFAKNGVKMADTYMVKGSVYESAVEGRRMFRSALREERELTKRLREALEESVKLQSHYALLLNERDGGQRLRFLDADAWLQRLEEANDIP